MKYYESPKRKKGAPHTALYITIACCLIAVGAVAWFASARRTPETASSSQPQSSQSRQESSQSTPQVSYNGVPSAYDIEEPIRPESTAEPAGNTVSDVPYEEPAEPDQALILPADGEIIKDFSDTALQFSATYNDLRLHTGIDIACANGTAVMAAGDGTVTAVDQSASLGNYVTIAHRDGIVLKYCGLESIDVVSGQSVKMGDPIGTAGTVPGECADKEHLHLEAFLKDKPISPLEVIGVLD